VEQALKKKSSTFLTMTWLGSLTQLEETCLTTSFSLIAASLLLILSTTGKYAKIMVPTGTCEVLIQSDSGLRWLRRSRSNHHQCDTKLHTTYTKIFATGIFHSDFRRWNDRLPSEQTWNAFKTHFAMSYCQHKQIQWGTAAASRYANASLAQPADEDLAGAAIYTFSNLATSTAVDRGSLNLKWSQFVFNKTTWIQVTNFEGNQGSPQKGAQRPKFLQDLCASQW
jgi:hypothetical protein